MESWAKADMEAINIHASARVPKIFFIVSPSRKFCVRCPAGLHLLAEMGCVGGREVTRGVIYLR
jgi:hypothetical protein